MLQDAEKVLIIVLGQPRVGHTVIIQDMVPVHDLMVEAVPELWVG